MGEAGKIPSIVLSREVLALDRKSEEWKELTKKVREACETYGCFVVEECEKVPIELQEDMFKASQEIFDLPQEKKLLCKKPGPLPQGYMHDPFNTLREIYISRAAENEVQALERILWPDGKPGFCEVFETLHSRMRELNLLVLRMIFESYGIGAYYESKALDYNVDYNFGLFKYRVPNGNDEGVALPPHTDKVILTILLQNSVQGLEALTKQGIWIPVNIHSGAMVVLIGDALEVWSNGRIAAVKHRVVMNSNKDRYSYSHGVVPKVGVGIELPPELVDEDHPPLYRPFVFSEYRSSQVHNISFDVLRAYAGI